jgi:hypothetical protein
MLKGLRGATFTDSEGRFGGGDWVVESGFAVTPHKGGKSKDLGTKEPHATLRRASASGRDAESDEYCFVRIESDDDARAFVEYVSQRTHAGERTP